MLLHREYTIRMKGIKLKLYTAETGTVIELPFVDGGIKAGFPSPAQDYLTESIDLNRDIIRHKESTFYAKVDGDSMRDAGISDGDIIVIDKALEAKDGDFVVAFIDGEFTVKQFRLDKSGQCGWLVPYNSDYSPVKVTEDNEFLVWGVITFTIKKMHKG